MEKKIVITRVLSIVLVITMVLGAVPAVSMAQESNRGREIVIESVAVNEYELAVNLIETVLPTDSGETLFQSPEPISPFAVLEDMYADSAVDQGSVPVASVTGSPDDVRYPLATNLDYARASGSTWGSGTGIILSVEIAAEWSSNGLIDDGATVRYYDDSTAGYGTTQTTVDSTNYATDYTLYLDITSDKPSWTWADIAGIHSEITFVKNGGPDAGASLYVDALWIRVQYESFEMEYGIPVTAGWNLISFPQIAGSGDILSVLDDCGGDTVWDVVKCYDSMLFNPWLGYSTFAPPGVNRLNSINHEMGLWVRVIDPGSDGQLMVSGAPPTLTGIILNAGWNLVGYPTLEPNTVVNALAGVPYDDIECYDVSSPYIRDMLPSETMTPGNGYWIHVPSTCVWNVGDVTPPVFSGITSANDMFLGGSVTLSWNPASDPSYPITYNVYMATTSGGQNFAAPNYVTDQTDTQIGGLTDGQPYYFVVRAQDSAGNEDSNSVERSATPTTPDTTAPQITFTVPANSGTGVALAQAVEITFSESINTGTFAYTCTPNPGGWSTVWGSVTYPNDMVTLSHANFAYGTSYSFQVTAAQDLAGNPLVAGPMPNPFSFTTLAAPDTTGPIVSGVSATPNPISQGSTLALTASVSDVTTGNSNVAVSEWSRGASAAAAGSGTAMTASDGNFNSPTESVTASISTAGWPEGSNTLWVRGRDAAGNWGNAVSTGVDVTIPDTISPQIITTAPVNGATGIA
ncbi:MAG: Ig-like domain-containing protein [Candidatus Thermoplasmatota archaeon]|nr:hypothetical protein [Euryarchaeota archaeon]MBU4033112.1 Ig-like domain-containing protein [Candidatus Thermoplasmatota archaeon]MBU4071506.1 Ig-like domain-containing protein [Candidatus Thermoplasmatota archaeon]MBU4143427.1 Ig-like domain-containing protein [Candidatus Thermoplasmatota archaeon]MBU4591425.1 Ig-like domain-containing protein [Candidatus Thermoplasmatota archaeon]